MCHSHYNFNVRVGYGQAIQMVMQAEWLACFWYTVFQITTKFLGFTGYNFEIFFISDYIIHSLIEFAMFAPLLFT